MRGFVTGLSGSTPECLVSQVLIVESYGGRDEPVDTLINNFVGVGVEPALDPVRVKEEPNESTYQVSPQPSYPPSPLVLTMLPLAPCGHPSSKTVASTQKTQSHMHHDSLTLGLATAADLSLTAQLWC